MILILRMNITVTTYPYISTQPKVPFSRWTDQKYQFYVGISLNLVRGLFTNFKMCILLITGLLQLVGRLSSRKPWMLLLAFLCCYTLLNFLLV